MSHHKEHKHGKINSSVQSSKDTPRYMSEKTHENKSQDSIRKEETEKHHDKLSDKPRG